MSKVEFDDDEWSDEDGAGSDEEDDESHVTGQTEESEGKHCQQNIIAINCTFSNGDVDKIYLIETSYSLFDMEIGGKGNLIKSCSKVI